MSARELRLINAEGIKPRAVRWLWKDSGRGRIPMRSLVIEGGRPGLGKSTFAFWLAAHITRGALPGELVGKPMRVIVVSTEDSWEHTIVPRLLAASADMSMVDKLIVDTPTGPDVVSLPMDTTEFRDMCHAPEVALVIFDPLISLMDSDLDSHKEADTRRALEPMAEVADVANVVIFGLVHINKSGSRNPLDALMNSRAFSSVPRAVLFMTQHPDEPTIRLVFQAKNNLGSTDLPVLEFTIEGVVVGTDDDGTPIETGRIVWCGESSLTAKEAMDSDSEAGAEVRTAIREATEWLRDYLTGRGPLASRDCKAAGIADGHSLSSIHRAARALNVKVDSSPTFQRTTTWELPLNGTP